MAAATQSVKPVPATPPAPSRMTLSGVVKGKVDAPKKIVLYGVEGIGKSTFGADAPKAIFLCAEDGTAHLDVARLPAPQSWEDILEGVRVLTRETHDYQTLVVDTVDWAEAMNWAFICRRDEQKDIEAYGYGKGYNAALDEWRRFLKALEEMRAAKSMNVILIAHSWIKSFKNPEGEDFDRYEMKLHAKAGGLLKEWADAVLFANYETFAVKDAKTKRVKGVDNGARLLFTQRRAAWDAKNRYSLPESIPLSWGEFAAGVARNQSADPAVLTAEIQRKAKELGGDLEKAALEAIARASGDAVKLAQLNSWANAKLLERA